MLRRLAKAPFGQQIQQGVLSEAHSGIQLLLRPVNPGLLSLQDWWQNLQHTRHSTISAGLKVYKPTTPGFRGRIITARENLWAGRPYRPLTEGLRKTGGRNNQGRITSWHRGGGTKRLYRHVDFARSHTGETAVVERLEYDPNRSARIALVKYPAASAKASTMGALVSRQEMGAGSPGGDFRGFSYVLAPQGVRPGDHISTGPTSTIRPGNTLPLSAMPIGQEIHNVELLPGKGGQLCRAAGTSATLVSRGADGYAVVRLPSGTQRRVLASCSATVGALSNPQHKNRKAGKAGASRWQGRRPVVRGVAMNPVDHPHGGGRGKQKGRISQSPWGKQTKGMKTRKKRNPTDVFIHVSRHTAKSKQRA